MRQDPSPGSSHVRYEGDLFEFVLDSDGPRAGKAWLRTNLGRGAIRRQEIVQLAERQRAVLARDWHDLPMRQVAPNRHVLTVPLLEVGCFEAKAYFVAEGADRLEWPAGANVAIKVEPAGYVAANTLYTAFVRQFGPNKERTQTTPPLVQSVANLEGAGYTVIPRSGTFRDLIRELDFIVGTLRCRIVQLLPIHPIPTTYARMGRFGSPFAALDFMNVDPALAEFDRRTTPLDQFRELVDAVHARDARLFIDLPTNHTGWASWLQTHHPEWFARNQDRSFQSPGAWGVTWEDLSKLDYRHHALWTYIAEVFLFWRRLGVDGFRCDAGYMVPQDAWRYIVARVREEYPDTVFMLEGLGGKLEVTEALLTQANLDWAYSELFQTYERGHIESYLPFTTRLSSTAGLLVHYAETHDNNRLAAASAAFARLRTGLTALCSANGAFGITAGVEWLATEKVDVHGASPLRWGATENLVAHVARLNTLLATHPCFGAEADFRVLPYGAGNRIAAVRSCRRSDRRVLVLVNLDPGRPTDASWPLGDFVPVATGFTDLLTGKRLAPSSRDGHAWLTLDPGAAHCLTPRAEEWDALRRAESAKKPVWLGVHQQQYKALALAILLELDPNVDPACHKPDDLAEQLRCDPLGFCRHAARDAYLPVVAWQWPADTRRRVMVPPHHLLCLQAPHPFQADVRDGDRTLASVRSLPAAKGGHFAFAVRLPADPARHRALEVVFTLYEPDQTRTTRTPLLALCPFEAAQVHRVFAGPDAVRRDLYGILANRRGTMVQARAAWASIASLYDALLAVNLAPSCPADRQVLLTRVRAWLRHREYSHEINGSCVRTFAARTGEALEWHLTVPAGMGKLVRLFFRLTLAPDANAMTLTLSRPSQVLDPDDLPDDQPVTLILRPDVDDRSCHGVTKAFAGPEDAWRRAVEPRADGFVFAPHPDRMLTVKTAPGGFTPEAEWTYHVAHPFESDRGLPDRSDLFSPGYFSVCLRGGESAELRAHEGRATAARCAPPPAPHRRLATPHGDWHPLSAGLRDALDDFVVRRDDGLTVIAGYPWFLDWGRDTLICLRGYIAAGALSDSLGILRQFARFEDRGTLPNMIRGNDASNRDTTDAPLWFLVACADLLAATGDPAFLDGDLGGKRTVRQVALSILEHYSRGTPNGVRMDPATGLVYSPPHFTWMDTNFPAATPRAGYPVEIQALWHAGLRFATQSLSPDPQWAELATRVRASFHRLFVRPGQAHLSDCLHAAPGQSAADAVPDDALRPNQLLAITLGLLRDEEKARAVVRSCDELLVPGGIRSLADRPVAHAQPIWRNGALLNDALRPYWGQYRGDEDTRRKPAYHNGTAWTWLFPSYAEALVAAFGPSAGDAARALLGSATLVLDDGCAGHVAEIADGDAPHTWRGCGAQAWGVTELQRVIALLTRKS